MKNYNMPNKVIVAGVVTAVKDFPEGIGQAKKRYGEYSYNTSTIYVGLSYPITIILHTLIHEINHAIFWLYNIEKDDDEERIVNTMANAWVQVYKDNPKLVEFIRKASL